MKYYSQIGQDRWVCEALQFKKEGVWVDIGCSTPIDLNNTYCMESQLGWRGISVDINPDCIGQWGDVGRELSGVICHNALTLDYSTAFKENELPKVIDYLSMDLEPPTLTLAALMKIPFDEYKFRCITFETDAYRNMGTQDVSRDYLKSKGYSLVLAGKQDDFWVYGGELLA
tara:strand:- start:57 stop:572 length:516 start_codon:yes stop_codon:yes gene_type:complete